MSDIASIEQYSEYHLDIESATIVSSSSKSNSTDSKKIHNPSNSIATTVSNSTPKVTVSLMMSGSTATATAAARTFVNADPGSGADDDENLITTITSINTDKKKNDLSDATAAITCIEKSTRSPTSPIDESALSQASCYTKQGQEKPVTSTVSSTSTSSSSSLSSSNKKRGYEQEEKKSAFEEQKHHDIVVDDHDLSHDHEKQQIMEGVTSFENYNTNNKAEPNGLDNVSINLFQAGMTTSQQNIDVHKASREQSVASSHPKYSTDSRNELSISMSNSHKEEEEEYEGGKYSLRHDAFLPSHQRSKSNLLQRGTSTSSSHDKQHQTLFDNLDRSFEKGISSASFQDVSDKITLCSAQEMKDVTKMCFAAMAVVFSSYNPSVTTMAKSNDNDNDPIEFNYSDEYDEDVICDIDHGLIEKDTKNHDSKSGNDIVSHNGYYSNDKEPFSIASQHQLASTPSTPVSRKNYISTIPVSPSLLSIMNGVADENLERDYNANNDEDDSVPDTLLNEGAATELIDDMELVQRPSVPLVIVHLLWKQLIKYRFHDQKRATVEKEAEKILECVQSALVNELGFLELIQYITSPDTNSNQGNFEKEEKDASEGEEIPTESTTVQCIQVNHDIHLQYGCYIAKNCTQFFPFYLKSSSKRSKNLVRTYDESSWNPEEALNATMAQSCLKFFGQYSSKYTNNLKVATEDQLQFEYSVEMLPWHLMRALLYRDVVDLLTDYSFVKSRMSVLEFRRAAQMHVSDAEELYNCINTFVAKYPNVSIDVNVDQVLVESYKLVGSVMHSEDSNRWQDEDIGEDDLDEKLDDESSSSITRVHSVSKALQALGDSLCRHNLKSEAMKFYYRAMLKFESINAAISDQVEKTESDTSKSPFMTTSHSHLLMGGILSRIGSVYESQNDIIDAMLCYERTLSFYSRHKSKHHTKGVAKVLASMGQMHFNLKEYEPALSCLQESLALWKSMDDDVEDDIANLLILMGNARREMGQLNEAICLFSEAMYDKVNVYGKSHPEVGFLHQTIGVVFCDKGEFEKGLSHFEDALRIRESALESVLSHFDYKYNAINDRVKAREIEVAECLRCIGQLHENCGDLEESFSHFVGNISIYRSHLITTVSNQATIMVSDLVNFLKDESSESTEVSNLYRHLIQAIQVGRQIYSIDTDKSDSNVDDEDIENLLELESQIAEILYDFGLIEGAQYLYRIKLNGSEDAVKLNEALRSDAKAHFEQSILIRKRMMKRLESFDSQDDNNTLDYEKITIALISYELGKLYSCQQHNMEDKDFKKRRSISFVGKPIAKDCIAAVSYFEDARETLEESIEMAETLDFINDEDDCWISRVHKTPEIYEEMLQTMAVLYRKLDEYDKSVECYNKVSMLLTRQEISEDDLEPNAEKGMLLCQKEKVAFSSQSIGEVLFDTGEYSRALKSYDEALQLRRSIESDSFAVADTLCLKGTVLLKLKKWDDAILTFDEAYRIRVDKLSRDHQDVARCFHFIGKAYAGDEKLQQAIEYFKKAQKIFSGHLNDTDINAADLFFDLGKIILQKEALSKHFHCEEPSEDDISLALICLALCRDIYKRNFGDTALEVGDVLNLLGLIYMKYGEYSKAITSFETALKIFHGAPLDQNLRIAKSLNNLGLSLTLSGTKDHDIIFEYLVLAKHIYEEKGACNTESYGELMYNMGEVNIRNDDIAEATTCYEIALATYEAVLGKEHVSISHSLEKLGTCLIRERKHNAAMKVLQKAIEIRSKHDHDRDLHSADIYFNMGIIHCETGNLNKAIDCYEEAVNIKTAALGNKDIQVAQILNNIGSVFARNREYQRALKPWQDAVEIYRNAGLSDEDPKVSCTIGNIEISKRFVSPTPVEHSIRNILSY